MSWKVSDVMEERKRFLAEWLLGEWTMSELCRKYGISRWCGYKWVARYEEEGESGLADRSRAPHEHPNAVDEETITRVVSMKRAYMGFGPKKIWTKLLEKFPDHWWPAPSTIGAILTSYGLVKRRRKRCRSSPSLHPLAHVEESNKVWCADFKGWFYTGDHVRCTPLTISDAHTRYFLRCIGLKGYTGYEAVRPIFEGCFREFGVPERIRTDNGPPFASIGLGGLSRLSVWWIKLGIVPERIEPGHPEQNGRHERLHRTLKEATASPPARTMREQQRSFDRFVAHYNEERPHEALGQQTPASQYCASHRPYPRRLASPHYPFGWQTRKVRHDGTFRWQGHEFYLAEPLAGEWVGFEPVQDDVWKIHFMHIPLVFFHERRRTVKPNQG